MFFGYTAAVHIMILFDEINVVLFIVLIVLYEALQRDYLSS